MKKTSGKRILIVAPYPPPYGGTTIPTRILEEWLLGRNYCVDRVNTTSGDKRGIPLIHPRAYFPFIKMFVSFAWKVPRADMVIVQGTARFSATAGALFVRIATLLGKKNFMYVHGGDFDAYLDSLPKLLRLATVWWMSRIQIVVQTEWLRCKLSSLFTRVAAIPNWTQLPTNTQVRKIVKGKCRFVFVGQIRQEKGIVDLLCAFKQVLSQMPGATLDLIGQVRPFFRDEFVRVLSDAGEGVSVHGGDYEHAEAMRKMERGDVMVFPTRFPGEGYPGAVIEAFPRGIPVIATAWRAVPEIVNDGVNGLLVDPDNVARELPQAMLRLAEDPQLYERLSAGALESARRFDINVVGRRMLEQLKV